MRLPVGPTVKRGAPREETPMTNQHRLTLVLVACFSFFFLATSGGKVSAQGQPEGQLTIAFDASIASSFLDPAETPGIGTPFVFLYALHDALIKPLPGNDMAPCLAESWRESPDGLVYEFKLREGLKVPHGDPRTAPGVELTLEANEQYWRKKPAIKRVVIKGVPDRTTRLAMLKAGEADIGYLMVGLEAATIKADPKLRLVHVIPSATWWLEFPEQWKPKSPWHDRRVRLAANLTVDRQGINEVERLGFSRLTGSIIPSVMEFALRIEPYPHDPAHAKRLLAEAGYSNGFDAGDLTPLPPFTTMGEAIANSLAAVGIRTRVRAMERATFMESWRAKKLQGIIAMATAAQGNAASRVEAFVVSASPYAYGGYPDIDDLFLQQAQERDRRRREALLHQIQRLMHERVMHAPIFEPATLHGIGPRVEEPAVGLNPLLYFAGPYEDIRLKKP